MTDPIKALADNVRERGARLGYKKCPKCKRRLFTTAFISAFTEQETSICRSCLRKKKEERFRRKMRKKAEISEFSKKTNNEAPSLNTNSIFYFDEKYHSWYTGNSRGPFSILFNPFP